MSKRDRSEGTGLGFTDYTPISVTVVCSSERAVRIYYEGAEEWLPRSLIEGECDYGDGECVEISIADWKLRELGWLE